MSDYQNNSIFWVETSKINPNPFQPRREFNQAALNDLADSIRQYGVLQPLVVTRKEEHTENGGISVYYELIAGERRLRAAKLAHLEQVPVIIRKDTDNKIKLELAIIENLQREDLNPIDRALAFEQLYKEFGLTHSQIGKKMGKSRVYVSNSLRLLSLPEEIKQGLMDGKITEGHTRPLLMLSDKPEEQSTLFREISLKKLSVRDSEKIARSIAQDRIRKKKFIRDPRIRDYEKKLSDNLGTRVQIEPKEHGGKILIDYFSVKDLESILASIKKIERESGKSMMDSYEENQKNIHDSKNALSKSGPINFATGEIQSFYKKEEETDLSGQEEVQKDDELKNEFGDFLEREENNEKVIFDENIISRGIGEEYQQEEREISSSDEKLLPTFEHREEFEINEYKEELPEYHHHENEELILQNSFQEEERNHSSFEKNNIHSDNLSYQKSIEREEYGYHSYQQTQETQQMQNQQDIQNNSSQYQRSADGENVYESTNYYQRQQNIPQHYYQNTQHEQYPQQNQQYQQQTKKRGFFNKLFH